MWFRFQARFISADFIASAEARRPPQLDLELALDTTLATYAAYVPDERGGGRSAA